MLEKWAKDDRDSFIESLRRSIIQLTKIRHPLCLTVQHPLEESRESLAFATEPVFASLANVLGDRGNLADMASAFTNFKLFEVEIKYGLMQVAEGIGFLHSDVKLLHRNICPESIIINKMGAWKIFGFDFCVLNQSSGDAKPYWPLAEYNSSWHVLTQPNLEYMAPEYTLISSHSPASDIYSLGVLIYTIYSKDGKPMKIFGKDFSAYKRFANDLKKGNYPKLDNVPEEMREYVKMMLNATPEMRPSVHEFTKLPFFDDVQIKTLSYLDSLFQWDNLQKSKFFKGLPQIIQKLPPRINMYRVLPCLVNEFVNPQMVPFVLPNVLLIAENATNKEYMKYVWVHLKPVMKIQEPIQILLIFMQKMELLLKLTPAEEVKTDVLPMLYRALESDAQQIQELCLSILPTFASMIDYPAMKNALLPRIKKLCLSTGLVSVRVNCLLCIGKLLEHLDKWLVIDDVIPFMSQIQSREPAVIMAILGIYKLALTHNKLGITKEVMANKIIPFLVPLSIENGLTITQFQSIMGLIKDMLQRVELEHKLKLEQLNSIKQESKELDLNFQASNGVGPLVTGSVKSPPTNDIEKTFSDLGLNDYTAFECSPAPIKAATPTTPFANGISQTMPKSTSLTFQDKQRMMQQQELNQRLQAQAPLAPTAAPIKTPNKPKDLTSTLIESNLNQIKATTLQPPSNQNNSPWNLGGSGSGISSSGWIQQTPTQPNNSHVFSAFQSAPAPALQWGNNTQTLTSPTNQWSSLNTYASFNNRHDKIPMNQMGAPSVSSNYSPLTPLSSNGNNNQTNTLTTKLSSNDIMDFLS